MKEEYKEDKKMKKQNKKQAKKNAMFRKLRKYVKDKYGEVVVSSTGFSVSGEQYPDYNIALIS